MLFLKLDLNDLSTIKASVKEFLTKESRLDVLWNNAGVMVPPAGSETKQRHELQMGTNCIGPFLFTRLLMPLMVRTAQLCRPGSVRVIWVSSNAAERFSLEGGIEIDNLDYKIERTSWQKYGASKAGNILHSAEFARRYRHAEVVSLSLDPGNLKTNLYRHVPKWQKPIRNLALKDPLYGAYTELFAGLSPEITMEHTGAWSESSPSFCIVNIFCAGCLLILFFPVEPWGHIANYKRHDIVDSCKQKLDGGTGLAEEFWLWTERQVRSYM